MLSIKTKKGEIQWYINRTQPCITDGIKSIQADGDELAYILNRFANIPCLNGDNNHYLNTHTNCISKPSNNMARGYTMN